ncbi:MAG: phage integrase SAM-like domain-containing protein [Prevotella sp.]|nr:phage integrase SAM-like domain-containing protein [Prevotella sp.]
MKLKPTILPAKVLQDGTHRIRIAMSHRGTTRYFQTRFIIPSKSNLLGGQVIGIPNASYINQQLLKQMSEIYQAFDKLEDTDYMTCSQLLTMIEETIKGNKPITLHEAFDLYRQNKLRSTSDSTIRILDTAIAAIEPFFPEDYALKRLDAMKLFELRDYLAKKKKLNSTTQLMYLGYLRGAVAFAVRHKKVQYDVMPFRDFEMPKNKIRDVSLSIEQLRAIRDAEFEGQYKEQMTFSRDLFMLSFYLCGMNLVDILRLDLSKDSVRFLRQKTASRRSEDKSTEFTIQPEARVLIDKLIKDGQIIYKKRWRTYYSLTRTLNRHLKHVAEACKIDRRLIYYSARKTFAQLSNELMIKDSIIEYCIGDSISMASRTIGNYIHINKRMADAAIRKVFDAVASTKSMDELVEESGL